MSLVITKHFGTLKYLGTGRLGEGELGRTDGRGRPDKYQLYDTAVSDNDGPNIVSTELSIAYN
jgi:hypothetical protein